MADEQLTSRAINLLGAVFSICSWTSVKYLLILAVSIRLLLPFCLAIFLPAVSISSFTPFSIGKISWTSPPKSGARPSKWKKAKEDCIRVTVGRVKWRCGWGGRADRRKDGCVSGNGWFVLCVQQVKVVVPRAWIVTPSAAPPKPPTSVRPVHAGSASRLANLIRSSLPLLTLFSVEVSFELVVEDALRIEGTVRAGTKIDRVAKEKRFAGWVALDGVKVLEVVSSSPPDSKKRHSTLAKPQLWPAVHITERFSVVASTPLVPLIKNEDGEGLAPGSVDVAVVFGQGVEGVHVRVHELKRIIAALEEIAREKRKQADASGISPRASKKTYLDENEERQEVPTSSKEAMKKIEAEIESRGPLAYLRSMEVSLPLFLISAHYNTPLHIVEASPSSQLPTSVAFALTVKAVKAKMWFRGNSNGKEVKKEHRDWIGKDRELAFGVLFEWGEIEGRVKSDASEEEILPDSDKAVSVSRSSLAVTSTWLPAPLTPLLPPLVPHHHGARQFNDETVVVEVAVGEIRGHTSFETLDSALRIFKGRPRPLPRTDDPSSTPETKILRGLPRIIGAVTFDGTEIRVQAPIPQDGRESEFKSEDKFFRSWASPDLFCISLPNGAASFGGEYRDRSVRRTEAERRAARKVTRRGRASEKLGSRNVDQDGMTSPTHELERTLGVPPPPLSGGIGHQTLPTLPTPTHSRDIDTRPLSYTTRLNVSADTLNVFLLVNNDDLNDEDETTYSNGRFRLPSDPVRFDIVAIGPIELTATTTLLGWESQSAFSSIMSPALALSTRSGEVNLLVETLGVDLWRPPIMGSLRDFINSFASASATSTLRRHVHVERPPPRPLIEILPADICIYLTVASLDLRIAGSDPKNDELACRGVAAHGDLVVLEYLSQASIQPHAANFPDRMALELREDIRVEANAAVAEDSEQRQALFKFTGRGLHLDPVVDARSSHGHTRSSSTMNRDEISSNDWELKNRAEIADLSKRRRSILPARLKVNNNKSSGLLHIPEIALRAKVMAKKRVEGDSDDDENAPLDDIVLVIESEALTFRFELLSIYLCLLAIAAVKSLSPAPLISQHSSPTLSSSSDYDPSPVKRPPPHFSIRGDFTDVHAFVTLPHNVPLYFHIRRLQVQVSRKLGVHAEWDMLLVAGTSPTDRGKWDDLIRFKKTVLIVQEEFGNSGSQPFVVSITSDSARLRIPFRYVFSQIIDNAANLVKSTKQLVHQLVKGGQDWILEPEVEEAKRLPKIDLNVKMFAVEIQDDPFETRLNIIWRAGYEEQLARLDRQAAFDAKVEAIHKMEAQGGEEETDTEDEDHNPHGQRKPKVTGSHTIGIEEARYDLAAYDSSHWIKRMRNAIAEQGRREEALNRRLYGAKQNSQRPDDYLPVELLPSSRAAPLARATFQDLRFVLSRPTFPPEKLPDFLFDVGKGLPRDTQFTLLVPLHFSWKMEEARIQLRDYPLPLVHIPPMGPGAGHEFSSWEAESDLVIAEEISGPEAIRRVPCAVVPAQPGHPAYAIVVPRSAMTVKTYATPTIKVRSPYATRIGWGNSIQPAIQDVARVVDTFTKASPDPSDRIGFWDKIRLQLHWRIKILFEGDGPVNIHLKGTRDPYAVTGFGAGFVKSWRGDVRFSLGLDNPNHEFFQIQSQEYILGIPNLREYVDAAASGMVRDTTEIDDRSASLSNGTGDVFGRKDADFVKIVAKFINGVRWGMGCVLERACPPTCSEAACQGKNTFHRQCRFFDFIPHWDVHTKTEASIGPQGEVDDSFAGFRSDFIHFSISLTSPLTLSLPSDTQTSSNDTDNIQDSKGYNSLHVGPQTSTHFWAWWRLFDGSMSLPIRQGKLFPSAQPPSKKFGKHCATIKYRFSLAPLFISHCYRQESWKDWSEGVTTLVGLKGKIGRFNVDLHQREQEEVVRKPNSDERKVVLNKSFYQAEVDCEELDLRVISAIFDEGEKKYVVPYDLDAEPGDEETPLRSEEDYVLSDEEITWVDLDDFGDAVYTIPNQRPKMRVMPFILCPRFTYYRQTDTLPTPYNGDDEQFTRSEGAKSKFGHEASHTCLMGCATDTITVQIESAEARLKELELQLRGAMPNVQGEIELRIHAIRRIIQRLNLVRETRRAPDDREAADANGYAANAPSEESSSAYDTSSSSPPETGTPPEDSGADEHLPHLNSTLYTEWGEWANRYMVHNPTIQITNSTREALLKYYYASRERRGFVYHLSAKAIKFINDLTKEHEKKHRPMERRKSTRTGSSVTKKLLEETQQTNRLLDDLVGNGGSFWAPNESEESERRPFGDALDVDPDSAADALPDSFDLQPGHLCMFIKPQIALRSDVDDKSTIIITAFRAQLKAFQVIDLRIPDDPVNRQVLNQTFATLDGLQAFYPREQTAKRSGASFVPLETLVDLRVEPWGFDRVVPRTSAALRYDKFNQLRMSSKHGLDDSLGKHGPQDSHFATGTDRVSVECDRFSVSANPDHFAAIYNVVTDLLLYSDPLQKVRNKKLEELVFTHDFANLGGVATTISSLQHRIRALGDLLQQFQVHLDELDDDGRLELFIARAEFLKLSAELNLVVQSIARAQNFNGSTSAGSKTAGIQFEARASELVWHMHNKEDAPFAKFSVRGVEFSWISKQDSSVSNRLVIKDLRALNSSPEQVFAEIIAKHDHEGGDHELAKVDVFAAILWNSLAPVGGIAIVEQFELHLHPVRLQLEHRVGRAILDYLFSQRRKAVEEESSPSTSSTSPKKSSRSSVYNGNGAANNKSSESLLRPPSIRSERPPSIRSFSGRFDDRASSKSSTSLIPSSSAVSLNGEMRLRRAPSTEVLASQGQLEGLDAAEMRSRASINRTFVLVDFSSTVLYLTYRSEKEDHSRLPDIYNITYRTPQIQYRNKTWSFLDLMDELKRDTIKSVWSQKGALIGQLLSTAHRRLPLQDARAAAKKSLTSSIKSRLHMKRSVSPSPSASINPSHHHSPLRIVTQEPSEDDFDKTPPSSSVVGTGSFDVNNLVDQDHYHHHQNGDGSSSSSEEGDVEENGRATEPVRVFGVGGDFSEEPETLSIASSDRSTPRIVLDDDAYAREESIVLAGVETRSLPALNSKHVTDHAQKHTASLPPIPNIGFPVHHPLPKKTTLNGTDEAKAKLLLGKSA